MKPTITSIFSAITTLKKLTLRKIKQNKKVKDISTN